jgi:uncharacterized RDD family membrane protein YckC
MIIELGLPLASRWKRLGGVLIEGILGAAIFLPIAWATGDLQRMMNGDTNMTFSQHVSGVVMGWCVFLILNGYLLFKRGQTIGKVVVKTKIVDGKGNIPSFGKLLFLRYLVLGLVGQIPFVGILLCFVDAMFIYGPERRCIHDYLAGTWVVEA